MKKKTVKYVALFLLAVLLPLAALLPLQTGDADRSDWMAALDGDAALNSLTIPGTHDSGALHSIADASGKCQSLPIKEQLKIGVRFLDIRLQLADNELRVVHSFVDQMTDFADVLADMAKFVRNHPSEFLLVSVKEDASSVRSDRDFTEVLEEMLRSYPEVSDARELPATVDEARGGIHILARYYNASLGVPCYSGWYDDTAFEMGGMYIQDNYCVPDTAEKIADIRKTYGVAAGKTYALVLNYTSCYLESCFPPIYAGLPAHDINRDTLRAMSEEYADAPLGILVTDFITAELADAIIGRNFG